MNSLERKELRYIRRKQKRNKNGNRYDEFDKVFTFENLWKAHKKSVKGVSWKASVQKYRNHAISNIAKTYNDLHSGKFKSRGFYEFNIIERGKFRHIQSVHISERVVQRCLCDYAIVPQISKKLIYDNGACMKDKGIDFSLNRMERHLRDYYNKNHTDEGYALMFDFSKYFDNIDHNILISFLRKEITDENTLGLLIGLINDFGDKGLGLGSQISQINAVFFPTPLDRFIKEQLRIKYYGRYMDDAYLIHHDKEYLKKCLMSLKMMTRVLGIKLNPKKTQIVKLKQGLPWLKTRFILTDTGKIYRKPYKKSIVRMRRKLKTFKRWLDIGKLTLKDIETSYNSWKGHIQKSNSAMSVRTMNQLYNKLFSKEDIDNGNYIAISVCQ